MKWRLTLKKITAKQAEALIDLSKHKKVILNLLDKEIKQDKFRSYRYHDESYYNQYIELKKVRDIIEYIFKDFSEE